MEIFFLELSSKWFKHFYFPNMSHAQFGRSNVVGGVDGVDGGVFDVDGGGGVVDVVGGGGVIDVCGG